MATPTPRVLLIGPTPAQLEPLLAGVDVTSVANAGRAADVLLEGSFDAVVATGTTAAELIDRYRRDETILANVDLGIASLDRQGRITWANAVLKRWCGHPPQGQTLIECLSPCTVASDHALPPDSDQPQSYRIHQPPPSPHPYLDVRIRPVLSGDGTVLQSVAIVQNVTAEVEQQKKLDILHEAGRDLAKLEADQLSEMDVPTRMALLRQNLKRYVHDLLHYDTIEVRTLDPETGELKPLIAEGMVEEAATRKMFARETGEGITGHVAFTGRSYLCPDTARDPLYKIGAEGAKSSLTAPLKYNDEIIGTLNIESPRINGFGVEDQVFIELLSKELAATLHTLDLLQAQRTCTLSASIEAVNKEIALPVDEVLGSAALLYARTHSTDPEMGRLLRRILDNARMVKDSVNKVHRTLATDGQTCPLPTTAGKRVLVIEQEERFRKQAHLMLGRLGVEVETVADPLEGLALCNGSNYDAIFLEMKPLGMRGFEAFCKFRLAEPQARVCLTTGFGWDESHTVCNARPHGLTSTLFKPFKIDQVKNALTAPVPPPLQMPAAV